jgi:hypothetical protein
LSAELQRLEAIVDASGAPKRVELLLPVGVRPRQLTTRTLLLAASEGRPAHLIRVHQALSALPQSERRRLGVITDWKHGPHQLSYRQVERTFGLVVKALSNDKPDGTPSEILSDVLDRLLEASIKALGEPASSSYAVDWTDHETWSRPPRKQHPDPNDNDNEGGDQDALAQHDRCADPEAAWGHRRGHNPGQRDEAFYGYYLQAATIVKQDDGPEVPELVRRIHIASCDHDPPARARAST